MTSSLLHPALRCAAAAGRGSSPEFVDDFGFGCPASLSPFQSSQEPSTLQTAVARGPSRRHSSFPELGLTSARFPESHICGRPRLHIPLRVFQMISDRFFWHPPFSSSSIYPQSNLSSVCFLLVLFQPQVISRFSFDPFQNKRDHPELSDRDSPGHFFFFFFIITRGFKSCCGQNSSKQALKTNRMAVTHGSHARALICKADGKPWPVQH